MYIEGQFGEDLPQRHNCPDFVDVALGLLGRTLRSAVVDVPVQCRHEFVSIILPW